MAALPLPTQTTYVKKEEEKERRRKRKRTKRTKKKTYVVSVHHAPPWNQKHGCGTCRRSLTPTLFTKCCLQIRLYSRFRRRPESDHSRSFSGWREHLADQPHHAGGGALRVWEALVLGVLGGAGAPHEPLCS